MINYFYWLPRISSLFLIGFFLIANLTRNEFGQFNSNQEGIMFLFFPIGLCLGQIIAWKWELTGGSISVIININQGDKNVIK